MSFIKQAETDFEVINTSTYNNYTSQNPSNTYEIEDFEINDFNTNTQTPAQISVEHAQQGQKTVVINYAKDLIEMYDERIKELEKEINQKKQN